MSGGAGPARLAEVELRRVVLALRTPFRSAHGTEEVRDVVLVRVGLDDGTVGWGECSALARPTYTAEHTAGAWAILRDELVPAHLAGRRTDVVGHPMAAAALATAAADADLRRVGRSLAEQLGRGHRVAPRPAVATCAVVGRHDRVDDLLAAVEAALAAGARAVKLKVAPRRHDVEAAEAVRATFPDLSLAVDLNGRAGFGDLALLDRLAGLQLDYLEQPVAADDLAAAADLAERLAVPIALDESITSRGAAEAAIRFGAATVLNVKPARLGGPVAAAQVVKLAADHGVDAFCGGMVETGVGRAAALAVAALPGCTLPTDLGPTSQYFDHDLAPPIERDADGRLPVPHGPGIGTEPEPARLDEVTVDRLTLPA